MVGLVSATHDSSVTVSPSGWISPNIEDVDFEFSVTNTGTDPINKVTIERPTGFEDLSCGTAPSSWTLDAQTSTYCVYKTTNDFITNGNSETFTLSATIPDSFGDKEWLVTTKDLDNSFATNNEGVTTIQTIQNAINTWVTGDGAIEVPAGTYNENIVIDKSITLQADGEVIIDGEDTLTNSAIHITAEDVTVQGFTVQNFICTCADSSSDIGAILVEGDGAVINNNVVRDITCTGTGEECPCGLGIDVHADNVDVTNNIVHDISSVGIRVRHTWNGAEAPVSSSNVLIDNNEVYRTGNSGVLVTGHAKGVTITNNEIYESLEPTPYSLVISMGANDVTIEDNDIRGGAANVIIMGSWDITINNNVIADAIDHYSDPENLKGKNIYIRPNSWYELPQQTPGVLSRGIEITNNEITGATGEGVLIKGGEITASTTTINNNIIEGNILYGVENAIETNVDAEENYWGDATGPYHETTNSGGLGNEVSNNVDYVPFCHDEICSPDTIGPIITFDGTPYSGNPNEEVSISITISDSSGISDYEIDWGDGTIDEPVDGENETSVIDYPTHTYSEVGEYTVSVTAVDINENEAIATVKVSIYEPADWEIELKTGQANFIAIPFTPQSTYYQDVLDSIKPNLDRIWSYEYNEDEKVNVWIYKKTDVNGAWSSGSLQNIVPGRGYIVFMKNDDTLYGYKKTIGGGAGDTPATPAEVHLANGYNLIGAFGDVANLTTNTLASLKSLGGDPYWYKVLNKDEVTITTMQPNTAYWVSMKHLPDTATEDYYTYYI